MENMDVDEIVDSQTDSEINDDEDPALRTRVPRGSSHIARQSSYIGRRGKPRCDNCRVNNLKCDRVLPTCNHCSFPGTRPCSYTPLPTPAHRGIPRCDRCREQDLRCDRNLPVCNCCKTDKLSECNYSPKKCHKTANSIHPQQNGAPSSDSSSIYIEPYPLQPLEILPPPQPPPPVPQPQQPAALPIPEKHIVPAETQPSPTIRFQHETAASVSAPKPHPRQSVNRVADWAAGQYPSDNPIYLSSLGISPWTHPSFIPPPPHILQRLASIPAADMPHRVSFNEHLEQMVNTLMPELRETAALPPEAYAAVARGLQKNDTQFLSIRRRTWTIIHRILSGSSRAFLLLMPRDAVFSKTAAEEERLRLVYQEKMDITFPSQPSRTLKIDPAFDPIHLKGDTYDCASDDPEWMAPFERIPVQLQIYDVLAYAHRSHNTSWEMVGEVRRAGIAMITWPMCETFVRLCPICSCGGGKTLTVVRSSSK